MSENPANAPNFNISAYRVLHILLHLVQHQGLNLVQLNHLLLQNALINKTFHEETVSGYINTLRKLGCQIQRPMSKNGFRYQLKTTPFPLNLDEEELHTIQKLFSIASSQPDEEVHIQLIELFQKVKWALPVAMQDLLMWDTEPSASHASVMKYRDLLRKYRKLCRDAQVLELSYQPDGGGAIQQIQIEPNQVVQLGHRLYLLGVNCNDYQKLKVNLERIVAYRQLPSKIEHRLKSVNVVFRLSGRLAKTYRLYPDEIIVAKDRDSVTVRAKTSDPASLLDRLMKYNTNCEVVSPDYVRQEMGQRIARLLLCLKGNH